MESCHVVLRSCTCFFREIRSQQGIWRKGVIEPSLFQKDRSGLEWKEDRGKENRIKMEL